MSDKLLEHAMRHGMHSLEQGDYWMAADCFDQVVRGNPEHGMAYFLSAYCKAMTCTDDEIMTHIDILFHGTRDMPVKISLMHEDIPSMLKDLAFYFDHLLQVMHKLSMRLKELNRIPDYMQASGYTKGGLYLLGENWLTLDGAKDDPDLISTVISGYKMMLLWTEEHDLPIVWDTVRKQCTYQSVQTAKDYLANIDNTFGISVMTNRVKLYEPDFPNTALMELGKIQQFVAQAEAEPPKKQGCYVATAVYGSYDCPEVWTLRRFRDEILAQTIAGRWFIRAYYAVSPTLVKWFGNAGWFNRLCKPVLDRMVGKLNRDGVENTPYEDSAK